MLADALDHLDDQLGLSCQRSGPTGSHLGTVAAVSDAVFVLDAVRTPIGKIGGALAGVRPDDLASGVIAALVERNPAIDPATIDDVHFGNGNGAGEENRNVARMASLLAGLPTSVPGATANRLCGSGMEAVLNASREIAVGDAVDRDRRRCRVDDPRPVGRAEARSAVRARPPADALDHARLADGQPAPSGAMDGRPRRGRRDPRRRVRRSPASSRTSSRSAATSAPPRRGQPGASTPRSSRPFGADLATDECVRANSSLESLAKLKPVFRPDGTVTAGNSSPMNDGAAAILLGNEAAAAELGRDPLARVVARAVSGIEPHLYGIGPVIAAQRALDRAGIGWSDLAVVELNEAFAAQSLACLVQWPDLDRSIVNPNGGAIAIGHPIGCSGARIVTTLAHELRRLGGGWGLATMCIGVGQGIAVVLHAD